MFKEVDFSVLACASVFGKGVDDITAISLKINKFGALEFKCAFIEDDYATLDKIVSRFPVVKELKGFTRFQKCIEAIHDILLSSSKIVTGVNMLDIIKLKNYMRPYRYTSLADAYFELFTEDINVTDIFDNVDVTLSKNSCAAIAEAFDIDYNKVLDFALLVSDAERIEWIPVSVKRACTYLAVECKKAGYDMSSIDTAVEALLDASDSVTTINLGEVMIDGI